MVLHGLNKAIKDWHNISRWEDDDFSPHMMLNVASGEVWTDEWKYDCYYEYNDSNIVTLIEGIPLDEKEHLMKVTTKSVKELVNRLYGGDEK